MARADLPAFRLLPVAGRPYWVPELPSERALWKGPSTRAIDHPERYDDAPCDKGGEPREEMRVPSCLVGALIGRGGANLQRLQRETGGTVEVPRAPRGGREDDEVVVGLSAPSAAKLEAVRARVSLLLYEARARTPPTHFLSIPLTERAIQERVDEFNRQVCQSGCAHLSQMLVEPSVFHLTLCVLKLLTASEISRAARILRDAEPSLRELVAAKCGGCPLRLHGVACMNDNPAAVDVLYAKVVIGPAHDAFQAVGQEIRRRLKADGLLTADEVQADVNDSIKAHATLINSRWQMKQNGRRNTFDATPLLRDFEEFDFGEAKLAKLHLYRRHRLVDGDYHCECAIALRDSTGT